MDIFASWEPKLSIDVCILSHRCKDCNIIKHINKDLSFIIYFDPSKCLDKDGYDGGSSLLCNDITTSALKDGYLIIRYGYYTIRDPTAQRFSYNRCVPYKGDMKHHSSKSFRPKIFYNDAKNICGPKGKKMCRTTIPILNECKCSFFFCNQK